MLIRKENSNDFQQIHNVIKMAFESAEHSDGSEHVLVERLRQGEGYIPELSLVAVVDEDVVGHIMFTKAKVSNEVLLALAPLSVLPEFQNKGFGSALINRGHEIAKELGYNYSVVLGSYDYYPRFGYVPADTLGIRPPFEVPRENFMAIKLSDDAPRLDGVMEYSKEFGINK